MESHVNPSTVLGPRLVCLLGPFREEGVADLPIDMLLPNKVLWSLSPCFPFMQVRKGLPWSEPHAGERFPPAAPRPSGPVPILRTACCGVLAENSGLGTMRRHTAAECVMRPLVSRMSSASLTSSVSIQGQPWADLSMISATEGGSSSSWG